MSAWLVCAIALVLITIASRMVKSHGVRVCFLVASVGCVAGMFAVSENFWQHSASGGAALLLLIHLKPRRKVVQRYTDPIATKESTAERVQAEVLTHLKDRHTKAVEINADATGIRIRVRRAHTTQDLHRTLATCVHCCIVGILPNISPRTASYLTTAYNGSLLRQNQQKILRIRKLRAGTYASKTERLNTRIDLTTDCDTHKRW